MRFLSQCYYIYRFLHGNRFFNARYLKNPYLKPYIRMMLTQFLWLTSAASSIRLIVYLNILHVTQAVFFSYYLLFCLSLYMSFSDVIHVFHLNNCTCSVCPEYVTLNMYLPRFVDLKRRAVLFRSDVFVAMDVMCLLGSIYYVLLALFAVQPSAELMQCIWICFSLFQQARLFLEVVVHSFFIHKKFFAYHYLKGPAHQRWHFLICAHFNKQDELLSGYSYIVFAERGPQWKHIINNRFKLTNKDHNRFTEWDQLPSWIQNHIALYGFCDASEDMPA